VKRNFNELFSKMTPAAQKRVNARANDLLRAMVLSDLRRAQAKTQQQLAQTLNVNQAWISRVERQTDMYLSTLRGYVEALGGTLEIAARFEGCVVRLDQFGEPEQVNEVLATAEDQPAVDRAHDTDLVVIDVNVEQTSSVSRIPGQSLFNRPLPDFMPLYGGGIYPGGEHIAAFQASSAIEPVEPQRHAKRTAKLKLVAQTSIAPVQLIQSREEGESVTTAA